MGRTTDITYGRSLAIALGLMLMALTPAESADGVRTITISASEFKFEPSEIRVEQGDAVRIILVNKGALSHNLHLRDAKPKTKTLQTGASDALKFTAEESGTVRFFCNVPGHKDAGMTGQISVE